MLIRFCAKWKRLLKMFLFRFFLSLPIITYSVPFSRGACACHADIRTQHKTSESARFARKLFNATFQLWDKHPGNILEIIPVKSHYLTDSPLFQPCLGNGGMACGGLNLPYFQDPNLAGMASLNCGMLQQGGAVGLINARWRRKLLLSIILGLLITLSPQTQGC